MHGVIIVYYYKRGTPMIVFSKYWDFLPASTDVETGRPCYGFFN